MKKENLRGWREETKRRWGAHCLQRHGSVREAIWEQRQLSSSHSRSTSGRPEDHPAERHNVTLLDTFPSLHPSASPAFSPRTWPCFWYKAVEHSLASNSETHGKPSSSLECSSEFQFIKVNFCVLVFLQFGGNTIHIYKNKCIFSRHEWSIQLEVVGNVVPSEVQWKGHKDSSRKERALLGPTTGVLS